MYEDTIAHLSFNRFVEVANDLQLKVHLVFLALVVFCLVLDEGDIGVAARLLQGGKDAAGDSPPALTDVRGLQLDRSKQKNRR